MPTVAWPCANALPPASAELARTMAIRDLLLNMMYILLLVANIGNATLVHPLGRPGQLVEHALQVERSRPLTRRELDQALDVAPDEDLGRHQQEDAIDAPAIVAHALMITALERIGLEVEQLGHAQGHHRILPNVEAVGALLHEDELPLV